MLTAKILGHHMVGYTDAYDTAEEYGSVNGRVVLDDDPSKDITAFARVRLTVRGGRTICGAQASQAK
jgi:hypothetical protein